MRDLPLEQKCHQGSQTQDEGNGDTYEEKKDKEDEQR